MARSPVSSPPVSVPPPDPADEVFLSPRVVDRQAFEDFAGSLRRLIADAAGEGQQLRAAAAGAAGVLESLREFGSRHQPTFQAAAEMLAGLDRRTGEARALVERAAEHAARVESFEHRAARSAQDRLDQLTRDLDQLVERALARLSSVEHQAAARAELVRGQFDQRLDSAEELLGAAGDRLDERVRARAERAEKGVASLEARLGALQDRLSKDAGARLDTLERLIARGEALADPASGLGSLADRVERARDQAEQAVRRFDAVREQADQARRLLGESLLESAAMIDRLLSRQDDLRRSLSDAAALCDAAEEALRRRLGEVRSRLQEPIEGFEERAQRLVRTLREAGEDAARARDALESAGDAHRSAARDGAALLARLEPWRALVLEGHAHDLPPALRAILDRVRQELGRDLGTIAHALSSVAGAGQRLAGSIDAGPTRGTSAPSTGPRAADDPADATPRGAD